MILLQSQQSKQVSFSIPHPAIGPILVKSMIVEAGVAVISFTGQTLNDWTRDTLSFPVGKPCAESNFISGIISASPASFLNAATSAPEPATTELQFGFLGQLQSLGGNEVQLIGTAKIQDVPLNSGVPLGCAVDSGEISYSVNAGQPIATLHVAVFGIFMMMLRVSYSVHILMGEKIIATSLGGTTKAAG